MFYAALLLYPSIMLTNICNSIWVSTDLSTAFITVYGGIFINTIHSATGQLQPRINTSETLKKKSFIKQVKGNVTYLTIFSQ